MRLELDLNQFDRFGKGISEHGRAAKLAGNRVAAVRMPAMPPSLPPPNIDGIGVVLGALGNELTAEGQNLLQVARKFVAIFMNSYASPGWNAATAALLVREAWPAGRAWIALQKARRTLPPGASIYTHYFELAAQSRSKNMLRIHTEGLTAAHWLPKGKVGVGAAGFDVIFAAWSMKQAKGNNAAIAVDSALHANPTYSTANFLTFGSGSRSVQSATAMLSGSTSAAENAHRENLKNPLIGYVAASSQWANGGGTSGYDTVHQGLLKSGWYNPAKYPALAGEGIANANVRWELLFDDSGRWGRGWVGTKSLDWTADRGRDVGGALGDTGRGAWKKTKRLGSWANPF